MPNHVFVSCVVYDLYVNLLLEIFFLALSSSSDRSLVNTYLGVHPVLEYEIQLIIQYGIMDQECRNAQNYHGVTKRHNAGLPHRTERR